MNFNTHEKHDSCEIRMKINPEQARTIIEVCQGHDCFGRGGGAVLLDIEELVEEYQFQLHDKSLYNDNQKMIHDLKITRDIRVTKGGCRNFCSVGPNVHVHTDTTKIISSVSGRCSKNLKPQKPKGVATVHKQSFAETSEIRISENSSSDEDSDDSSVEDSSDDNGSVFVRSSQHFANVCNTNECEKAAKTAGILRINSEISKKSHSQPSSLVRMLRMKNERMRWQTYREVARWKAYQRNHNLNHNTQKLEHQESSDVKADSTKTVTSNHKNPILEIIDDYNNKSSSLGSNMMKLRQTIEDAYNAEVAFDRSLQKGACDSNLGRAERRKERLLKLLV